MTTRLAATSRVMRGASKRPKPEAPVVRRYLRRAVVAFTALVLPLGAGVAAAGPAGAVTAPGPRAAVTHSVLPRSIGKYNAGLWHTINDQNGFDTETNFSLDAAYQADITPANQCPENDPTTGKGCTGADCWSGGKVYAQADFGFDCMWVYKPVVKLWDNLGALGLTPQTATPIAISMVCGASEFVDSANEHGKFTNEQQCIAQLLGPWWSVSPYDPSSDIFFGSEQSNTLNWWFYMDDVSYVNQWYDCFVGLVGPSMLDPFTNFDPADDASLYEDLWNTADSIMGKSASCA